MHLSAARTYTVTTKTSFVFYAGTDNPIYLRMYDSADNSCEERQLNVAGESFWMGQ